MARAGVRIGRLAAIALLWSAGAARAQMRPDSPPPELAAEVSPLPPPATRADLRGRWFEFLSALNEDDYASAKATLDGMLKTAERAGIARLSDFSRGALSEARQALRQSRRDRARVALDAAIALDPDLFDARWERIRLSLASGDRGRVLADALASIRAISAARESRREFLSDVGIVAGVAFAGATVGLIIALFVRHIRRIAHDVEERTQGFFGGRGGIALTLAVLGLPLWVSFGPFWLIAYWAVIACLYAEWRERMLVAVVLLAVGFVGPLCMTIADQNLIARSPLVAAATDLEERKEEGGSVDLLRQAARVFPEDSTVWYLLGRFAQRREDYDEAVKDYSAALRSDPADFRSLIALGNIHFWQGELATAIQDYRNAVNAKPDSALAYYNLSLAQGDAYLFDQQKESISNARKLAPREVDHWIETPVAGRVRSVGYSVKEAVERSRQWSRQTKSQMLPGVVQDPGFARRLASPIAIIPWAALVLALLLKSIAGRRGFGAAECARCGKAFCARCKAKGASPLYCQECIRLYVRKEEVGIAAQVARSEEAKRQQKLRRRERRLVCLFLPGARRIAIGQPVSGFLVLFGFAFLISTALLAGHLFPVQSMLTLREFSPVATFAFAAAFLIWIVANIKVLRD
jgi:hypothetical protein